jgi:hypothetical protein
LDFLFFFSQTDICRANNVRVLAQKLLFFELIQRGETAESIIFALRLNEIQIAFVLVLSWNKQHLRALSTVHAATSTYYLNGVA